MECSECEDETGDSVKVTYTDGSTEELVLCERCRKDFAEGVFVDRICPPGEKTDRV